MAAKPKSVRIRSYDVGFGDCFLLTVKYPSDERHVLIDFGSFPKTKRVNMEAVAQHVRKTCGGKLHGVVATHRHADHINGFATKAGGKGSGDIIRSCKPSVVVQPWTEHPRLAPNAAGLKGFAPSDRQMASALRDTAAFLQSLTSQLKRTPPGWRTIAPELRFLGENGISNKSAVKNLMTMAPRAGQRYVHFGSSSGLGSVLPGVRVRVLGPPTIKQHAEVEKQRSRDETEFWHILAASPPRATPGHVSLPFEGHRMTRSPGYARWLIQHADAVMRQQILSIVRRMDDVLNNTSVILLFEVGKKRLLFPGDAQLENWSYALGKPDIQELLSGVDVYKVGHHGSLNATPKQGLWERFEKKGKRRRLITFLSTEPGHHGCARHRTEVPRRTLVDALTQQSKLLATNSEVIRHDGAVAFVEASIAVT